MKTWGVGGRRGIVALVGVAVVLLSGTGVPPAALADELGDSAPAKGSVPLREGQLVTVAGTGEEGYSGDGHDALEARINALASISVGPDGSVYIADSLNERLRVVSPDGVIDTVPDGSSQFVRASAVGPDGSLYLAADDGIRQVDESGEHHVHGGPGSAWPEQPRDIAVGDDGTVYVADRSSAQVRSIDPEGTIATIAGGGDLAPGENEGGQATESQILAAESVAVDSTGTVYVSHGGYVSEIAPDGTIRTIVGLNEPGNSGDGGPVQDAQLGALSRGLAVDADDNVYIADPTYGAVRRVDDDGVISTVGAELGGVGDFAIGPDGNLYFVSGAQVKMFVLNAESPADDEQHNDADAESPWADRDPGDIATVAGDLALKAEGIAAGPGGSLYVIDGERGPLVVNPDGSTSSMSGDVTITAGAGDGSFYVTTVEGGVHRVYPDGGSIRMAGGRDADGRPEDGDMATAHRLNITDLAVDPNGMLHMLHHEDGAMFVYRLEQDGTLTVVAEFDEETDPLVGIAVDSDGVLYGADWAEHRVVRIDGGDVTTVAGSGSWSNDFRDGDGGDATDAVVAGPTDVAVTEDGTLYIADQAGVRRVDAGGTITTLYEAPDDVPGDVVRRDGLSVGSNGDVYFVDAATEQVRVIVQADEVSNPNPFPWGTTGAAGLSLIVVVGVALGIWRRRQLAELIQRLRREIGGLGS